MKRIFLIGLLLLLIAVTCSIPVWAQSSANDSGISKQMAIMQKVQDYNQSVAESTLSHVTFLIAFLAGILSFLAPCTVALFPAFLAYATGGTKSVTLATTTFFAGFSSAFVAIGVILTAVGRISFVTFQQDISVLIQAIGLVLVFLGVLMFFGKGISSIHLRNKLPKNTFGTFIFGAMFAVGWSACIGPVIAGIFAMAAVFHNYAYTALLLFFYSLGLAIPLFLASFAYDKFDISRSKLLTGFAIALKVGKTEVLLTGTNMLSGILLILLGLFFIINQGTTAITGADLLGTILLMAGIAATAILFHKLVIGNLISSINMRKIAALGEVMVGIAAFAFITNRYSIRTTGLTEELSRPLLGGSLLLNLAAGVILLAFAAALYYFVRKHIKENKKG